MKKVSLILMVVIPIVMFAAEIPTKLLGELYNDLSSCMAWKSSNCKSYICITSNERDCQLQCDKKAQEDCKKEFDVF